MTLTPIAVRNRYRWLLQLIEDAQRDHRAPRTNELCGKMSRTRTYEILQELEAGGYVCKLVNGHEDSYILGKWGYLVLEKDDDLPVRVFQEFWYAYDGVKK